jgi:transcriptional regulator with XRE-family HTH domain
MLSSEVAIAEATGAFTRVGKATYQNWKIKQGVRMNRAEFGQLVAALRAEHLDEHNRPWTQAKLAKITKLPVTMIGKIERGEKANLEADTLLKLADALMLTSRERKEFFLAASGVDHECIPLKRSAPGIILRELTEMMEQLQGPAFLIDNLCNLLYVNPMFLTMYDLEKHDFEEGEYNPLTQYHLIRLFFAPEFERQRRMMSNEQWSDFASRMVRLFRIVTFNCRAEPSFQALLAELTKYRPFLHKWQSVYFQESDHIYNYNCFSLRHPQWGVVHCLFDPITAVTAEGDLHLYSFQPLSRETAQSFAAVVRRVGSKPYRLSPWPI